MDLQKTLEKMASLSILELHLYGNNFCKESILSLLDSFREKSLKKFVFSIKEFEKEQDETVSLEVLEAFDSLDIEEKKLC